MLSSMDITATLTRPSGVTIPDTTTDSLWVEGDVEHDAWVAMCARARTNPLWGEF
jgi:hypothetical protein